MPSKILLLTPVFYGIEKKIKTVLEDSGYEVKWIENKNLSLDFKGQESKLKLLRRIYFFLFSPRIRYIKKSLKELDSLRFDILFSINCHIICPYLIKTLKNNNPDLLSILYLWDSSSKYSWNDEIKLFNKVYTFDSADSKKYMIEYKPNFYVGANEVQNYQMDNDLSFVGKFSPERFQILESLIEQIKDQNLRFDFWLWPAYRVFFHNYLLYGIMKMIKLKGKWINNYILTYEANEMLICRNYIKPDRLSFEEAQARLISSNVILDLPFENQAGYTHRLIESLAKGKKVITTNQRIRKERFYNPDQIHIIDTKNAIFDIKWIKEEKKFEVDDFFKGLELSDWLNSIFNARFA